MKDLWTWSGTFLGHRDSDELWTHNGRHIGHFYGDEIYGSDGRYLGEIKRDNRLITCLNKKSWRKARFTPHTNRSGFVPPVGCVGYVMYAGCEVFPTPEDAE